MNMQIRQTSLRYRLELGDKCKITNFPQENKSIGLKRKYICSQSHCFQEETIRRSHLWCFFPIRIYTPEICLHWFISSYMHVPGWTQKPSCFSFTKQQKTPAMNGSAAETILCSNKCYYCALKWFLTLGLGNNVNTSPLWDCPPHYDKFVCDFLTNSIISHPNYH